MTDYNGYNLTTELKVTFKRKNKIYKKSIYILMNDNMKKILIYKIIYNISVIPHTNVYHLKIKL